MTLTPVEGSAAYFETRDKIAAARERQLAAALAENERLRAALDIARTGLLKIERRCEEARTEITRVHEQSVSKEG